MFTQAKPGSRQTRCHIKSILGKPLELIIQRELTDSCGKSPQGAEPSPRSLERFHTPAPGAAPPLPKPTRFGFVFCFLHISPSQAGFGGSSSRLRAAPPRAVPSERELCRLPSNPGAIFPCSFFFPDRLSLRGVMRKLSCCLSREHPLRVAFRLRQTKAVPARPRLSKSRVSFPCLVFHQSPARPGSRSLIPEPELQRKPGQNP